jgi:AAA+ ATPase superfamily predicted ATPase
MNMGSEMKVDREEANEIKKLKGWILIYGRRKVGKTFLIKNFLDWDYYFTVKRDGKIEKYAVREIENIKDFVGIVSNLLSQNSTVVIDEFQRLPSSTVEEIAMNHPKGKIIFS